MKTRLILLWSISVFALGFASHSWSAAILGIPHVNILQSNANDSLATFRTLLGSDYRLMGFNSTNEVATASNGVPILAVTLPWNQLTNYSKGNDIGALIEPAAQTAPIRAFVPIVVDGKARSSISHRLELVPGIRWKAEKWGQPNLIRDLAAAYNSIPASRLRSGSVPFAIELEVFDIWLVGYYNRQNKLVLLSTADMRFGNIVVNRGQVVTAEALETMAMIARRYNGLPN